MSPEKNVPGNMVPEKMSPRKNDPRKNVPRKNVPKKKSPQEKMSPEKMTPRKNVPRKNVPEIMSPREKIPPKMCPGKMSRRRNYKFLSVISLAKSGAMVYDGLILCAGVFHQSETSGNKLQRINGGVIFQPPSFLFFFNYRKALYKALRGQVSQHSWRTCPSFCRFLQLADLSSKPFIWCCIQ